MQSFLSSNILLCILISLVASTSASHAVFKTRASVWTFEEVKVLYNYFLYALGRQNRKYHVKISFKTYTMKVKN